MIKPSTAFIIGGGLLLLLAQIVDIQTIEFAPTSDFINSWFAWLWRWLFHGAFEIVGLILLVIGVVQLLVDKFVEDDDDK
tara:strand:+ start:3687 stop:3926 length:240 start_codon:yes stop_codon:yes gene_type:complete